MTSRKNIALMTLACTALVAMTAVSLLVAAPQANPDEGGKKTAEVGKKAPDFTLKDTAGKTHKLSEYTKQGKIVVIEWFNPGCPFIKLHHEKQTTMNDMHKDYAGKNVVFFAINSTNKDHPNYGKDAEAKKEWKIPYAILGDADGKVGHAYGAKTTPHMFVIDKDGKLAYAGAMDNDPRNEKSAEGEDGKDKKINYVRTAIDELVAGKKVTKSKTKPYGCSVKY